MIDNIGDAPITTFRPAVRQRGNQRVRQPVTLDSDCRLLPESCNGTHASGKSSLLPDSKATVDAHLGGRLPNIVPRAAIKHANDDYNRSRQRGIELPVTSLHCSEVTIHKHRMKTQVRRTPEGEAREQALVQLVRFLARQAAAYYFRDGGAGRQLAARKRSNG